MNIVKTSYDKVDVTILLQDIRGKVEIIDTAEREKKIQSGVHYSEMLPLEYKPTEKYMQIYDKALSELSYDTALGVCALSEKLWKKHGENLVIVSLARAGTPIGVLVKRYIKYKYECDVKHYTISIIRGKGIDIEAMRIILSENKSEYIQFLDGWVGKGAINNVLHKAVEDLKIMFPDEARNLNSELAVLSDPANITDMCGTHADFLIPSACLNATVSGLISRTVKLPSMTDNELHGAVYYEEYEDVDKSIEFIDKVCSFFDVVSVEKANAHFGVTTELGKGVDDLKYIQDKYNIEDVNFVKPGVGETTRVLLRRVPYVIVIKQGLEDKRFLRHILQLASEKGVPVVEEPLKSYNVIGVIKQLADV